MSSSSSGWLEQDVRWQRSEIFNAFGMQSHASSSQAFVHIHDISSIAANDAGSPLYNLSPISLELRHLQETYHEQLEMERCCFVENFSISPLDSWLTSNAYTSLKKLNPERLTIRLGSALLSSVSSSLCICWSEPTRFRYFWFVRWPFLEFWFFFAIVKPNERSEKGYGDETQNVTRDFTPHPSFSYFCPLPWGEVGFKKRPTMRATKWHLEVIWDWLYMAVLAGKENS